MVDADIHLKLLSTSILEILKWAYWYAAHKHLVAALHSYTHPTWLKFWGSGSLVELKWCDYVIVEADSHLKLLLTSLYNIYRMFEHIGVLSMGIQ